MNRRQFLSQSATAAAGMTLLSCATNSPSHSSGQRFKISLAQWSLHKAIFGKKLDNLDFARTAKQDFGIEGIEYVNQFWMDKATDKAYLAELKKRADGEGVKSLLIMCDREGALGDADEARRTKAVENHYKWVEAGKYLGCHSIRVNAQSSGSYDEQLKRSAGGLRRLSEFAAKHKMNVIVENHGGLSSNGEWLAAVMREVKLPNCGTLPDFGNWNMGGGKEYDRYKGTAELMPFAKGVSAKSHDFDSTGNEIHTDFRRMMKIVAGAKYRGYVGIEYEGSKLSEHDGIRATKALLEKIFAEMA